jgi:hypothetical protein
MNRRDFIRLVGGGFVTPALTGCDNNDPNPASAWASAGKQLKDPRLFALSYALLAPNPHNRQPWIARLDSDDVVSLFLDRSRLLPVTDPFDRQIVIGCGAFIELFCLAASARGFLTSVDTFPEGASGGRLDYRPVARLRLAGKQPQDPLFDQILDRRTNRVAYDMNKPVSLDDLNSLTSSARATPLQVIVPSLPRVRSELRALTRMAWITETTTLGAHLESVRLTRIGSSEIAKNRDGISLSGPVPEVLSAAGILTRPQLAKPGSFAFDQDLEFGRTLAANSPAFVAIVSPGNRRGEQLAAGRAYARINLEATRLKLSMQPMSQGLQEYRSMQGIKRMIESTLEIQPGQRLQMLARVGYAAPPGPSPRRGLKALMGSPDPGLRGKSAAKVAER